MSTTDALRRAVTERLAAAAEEVLGVFCGAVVQYEEEIRRQRRLLEALLRPEVRLHRAEPPQVCQDQVRQDQQLKDQQLWNQDRSSSLVQDDPDPPLVKEEQQEVYTGGEGEQPRLKLEADSLMWTHVHEQRGIDAPEPEPEPVESPGLAAPAEPQSPGGSPGDLTKSTSHLKMHMRLHTGERPYECHTCGKDFRLSRALKVHLRTAHPAQLLLCKSCGKGFGHPALLQLHVCAHGAVAQLRPHSCQTCGKTFVHKSSVKTHTRRAHAGEKPYQCSTCGKRFTASSTLKSHATIHTGEKPYACAACGKAFRHNFNLDEHFRRLHTGERPHLCSLCGKTFSLKRDLQRHATTHTGHGSHHCRVCREAFSQPGTLLRHMELHAGENAVTVSRDAQP